MPIRPLSAELVRHLAAGEVVDRPVSLVKELLENALDAGATRLVLELEAGGMGLVRIIDNGHGIRQSDIPHLLQRHSTSKINELSDLHAIDTLGFRGEALYSIAAVTRFRLLSRHCEEELGTELTRDDEAGLVLRAWGGPVGTTIEARDLFYNLPARRKFLKGASAEYGRIIDMASRYALAIPGLQLEVSHNGRRMLQSLGTSAIDPLLALYGADTAGRLLPVDWAGPGLRITGFISDPASFRATRKDQTLLVNGRWIRDAGLQLAVERAYGVRIPAGKHPLFVLRLEMPPEEVDVNVHPHKTEVRFADATHLMRALTRAADQALASLWQRADRPDSCEREEPTWLAPDADPSPIVRQEPLPIARHLQPMSTPLPEQWDIDAETGEVLPVAGAVATISAPPPRPASLPLSLQAGTWLQYGPGLIALVAQDTLIAIDLPALHARVLYERLCDQRTEHLMQPLLLPIPLALEPRQAESLTHYAGVIAQLGFELDTEAQLVRALPSALAFADPARLIAEILTALDAGEETDTALPDPLDRARRIAASRAVDRSGRPRRQEEVAWLLEYLEDHRYYIGLTGQPTILRLDAAWWSRMFGH